MGGESSLGYSHGTEAASVTDVRFRISRSLQNGFEGGLRSSETQSNQRFPDFESPALQLTVCSWNAGEFKVDREETSPFDFHPMAERKTHLETKH